jgi:branched-chain amino acid transport system substrate-binding protein
MTKNFIYTLLFLAYLIKPIQAEEITLGALLHLSGDYAMEGAAFREGIELGLEDANRELIQKNITLKVDFQDTRLIPVECATLAHRAAANRDIKGLIVSSITEIKPISPIMEKNKVPAIVLWDATPEIENYGDYVFGIGAWAPDTGEKSARFTVRGLQAKRAFIIYPHYEWSIFVKDSFIKQFNKSGGQLEQLEIDLNESDFKTHLLKIKKFKPDVVYAPIVHGVTTFMKQVKTYLPNTKIIMSDVITEHLIQEDPKAFEGIYHSAVADPDNVISAKLKEQYTNKYHKAPGLIMFNAWGYDSVLMYKEAIMKGARTREEIKGALYQIKDLQGTTGDITVNSKGSSPKYISMFQVKNSKLELIESPDPEL